MKETVFVPYPTTLGKSYPLLPRVALMSMKIILTIARWGLADVAALGRHTPGPVPWNPARVIQEGGYPVRDVGPLTPGHYPPTTPLSVYDLNDGTERTRSEVQRPLSDITVGL